MTGEPLIRATGLDVTFHGRPVLDGVDLTVERGEILTVIGPNGAGKTTLVRAVLGLLPVDAGTIERRPGLRIGYMPQRLTIDPVLPLTVRRFLTLGHKATPAQMEAALKEVGAPQVLDSPVQRISGGEMQRVLLARALLRKPELLILDEPVQGVDVTGQSELYALIRRLRDRHGCGVLMVSHDLHLVMAATDKVICLNGHVCCSGHPQTVSQDPAYLDLFGRQMAANFAVYTHHHDPDRCGEEPHHHG